MEFKYNNHSKKSGVYKITNRINGKIYIGSAKRFQERASGHLSSLRSNKHQNGHLNAYRGWSYITTKRNTELGQNNKYVKAYKQWREIYETID